MPRQWKFIALYMVLAYLAFVAVIHNARNSVEHPDASQSAQKE